LPYNPIPGTGNLETPVPPELHTTDLRRLIDRIQRGDEGAFDELFERAAGRLKRLAHAMLRDYPLVQQREQTADVVQEAAISLVGALRQLSFTSTREFYGLAAEHIRRRLLDLNRRHGQPHRDHASLDEAARRCEEVLAEADEELEQWAALHEAAETLPADLREVFCLRFYHGWSLADVAGLLEVSTRTATRMWCRAQLALLRQLGGRPVPGQDAGG
jgi:RNA polymerase sigma-70 factor (ECF subfamily)